MTSTTIPHTRTRHVGIFTTRKIPARTLLRGRYYAPIENFKDPETENVTVTHPWTRNDAIEKNYMISTTILHTRTFYVKIFTTGKSPSRTLLRGRYYWGFQRSQDWFRLCYRKMQGDATDENYMISTTNSHPRTFHVEICSTRETPARTFKRRRGYAAVEDFQDLETYWKRDCGTSLNVRPCNERKLHDIDNYLKSTHFSSRNVLDAWDNREDI